MFDSEPNCLRNGEPLESVPLYRWTTTATCGEGENLGMAPITEPHQCFLMNESPPLSSSDNAPSTSTFYDDGSSGILSVPSIVPSPDENVPAQSNTSGPDTSSPIKKNKFSKNTIPKSSRRSRNSVTKNDSHVGEQTPHTRDSSRDTISDQPDTNNICMRVTAVCTPQPIRVRNIPLPPLSWTDNADLSLLLCFKEDIGLMERSSTVFRRNQNLNTRMRAILFDWLMEVCDVYKLRRLTYYLAIDYIDRYLSKTDVIPKNYLQLLGITCLFIASKVEEIYPPKVSELAYVTDGACTDIDMLAKEMEILQELRWEVNPTTVIGWLCLYLQLACTKAEEIRSLERKLSGKDDDVIYPQFSPHLFMTGSMILDLCSLDDGMLQFQYSEIAASVVYFVLNREKALFVSGYKWEKIKLCVEWLEPFAVVVFRSLTVKPLVAPREYLRTGSALRVANPSIVLDEGHTLQNHVIDLKMLEEVYNEIQSMRQNYKIGKIVGVTGWTATTEGYDPSNIVTQPSRRKVRRKNYRTSFAEDLFRNNFRGMPIDINSDSDHEQRKGIGQNNTKKHPSNKEFKQIDTQLSEHTNKQSDIESEQNQKLYQNQSSDSSCEFDEQKKDENIYCNYIKKPRSTNMSPMNNFVIDITEEPAPNYDTNQTNERNSKPLDVESKQNPKPGNQNSNENDQDQSSDRSTSSTCGFISRKAEEETFNLSTETLRSTNISPRASSNPLVDLIKESSTNKNNQNQSFRLTDTYVPYAQTPLCPSTSCFVIIPEEPDAFTSKCDSVIGMYSEKNKEKHTCNHNNKSCNENDLPSGSTCESLVQINKEYNCHAYCQTPRSDCMSLAALSDVIVDLTDKQTLSLNYDVDQNQKKHIPNEKYKKSDVEATQNKKLSTSNRSNQKSNKSNQNQSSDSETGFNSDSNFESEKNKRKRCQSERSACESPPKKKRCKGCASGSHMLPSPRCSRLYLRPEQRETLFLRSSTPECPVLPPSPKLISTRPPAQNDEIIDAPIKLHDYSYIHNGIQVKLENNVFSVQRINV